MRIFVFRPLADAQKSAAALEARGLEPVVASLFTIEALDEPAPEGEFAALILTSGNAVPSLAAAESWKLRPVFAVGARTAEKLREAGFGDVRSADGNRDDLIALVGATLPASARLLLVTGKDHHDDLPARLSDLGYEVSLWTAYEARAVATLPENAAQALRAADVQAALHYSPRGAQTFLTLAREAGLAAEALDLTHAAFSAEVAAPLITAGAGTVVVAEYPEEAALMAALEQVLGRNKLSGRHVGAPDATQEQHAEHGQDGHETGAAPDDDMTGAPQTPATRRRRSGRTPPTIEARVETRAEDAAVADVDAQAAMPTEALRAEFAGGTTPSAQDTANAATPAEDPVLAPIERQDASEGTPDRPEPQAQPAITAPSRRSRLPELALAGLVGGVIGAGIALFADSLRAPDDSARQIAELSSRLDGLATRSALETVDRKVGANQTQITALVAAPKGPDTESVAALRDRAQRAETAATTLGQRLDQTSARIGTVETLTKSAAAPSPQALAAARIVLAERVQSAIASGQPFAADVAALVKGGGNAEQIAALNAVAATGAPTQGALKAQLRAHKAMFAGAVVSASGSWRDTVAGLANRIVTIRSVGDTRANDTATLPTRLDAALERNDIGAAATLWDQLPEPARRESADFGAALRKRAAADAAIARIAQEAVAALGAAG